MITQLLPDYITKARDVLLFLAFMNSLWILTCQSKVDGREWMTWYPFIKIGLIRRDILMVFLFYFWGEDMRLCWQITRQSGHQKETVVFKSRWCINVVIPRLWVWRKCQIIRLCLCLWRQKYCSVVLLSTYMYLRYSVVPRSNEMYCD
jgi:hypothetical protein